MRIALVLVGRTIAGFNELINQVNREFKAGVTTAFIDLPMTRSFRSERRQYDAQVLLRELVKFASLGADATVYITREDLFAGKLNFVFGLTEANSSIVSTARLDPRFYGAAEDAAKANAVFKERITKEVFHEIGHSLGFGYCKNKKCVMVFSDSIADVDSKEKGLCEKCKKALRQG